MPFRTEKIVFPRFMIPKINWFHIWPKINKSIEYSWVEINRVPFATKLRVYPGPIWSGYRLVIPVPESEWIKNDSPSFKNEIFLWIDFKIFLRRWFTWCTVRNWSIRNVRFETLLSSSCGLAWLIPNENIAQPGLLDSFMVLITIYVQYMYRYNHF